jgi:UDP-GlcNAc:undecaprenyl-phosphate GlcNAc-1-phosphate transferase
MEILLIQCLLLIAAILGAYGISYRLSLWSIGAGERWGVVSHVTDRSSHTVATSRLGGLALFAGMALPALTFVLISYGLPHRGVMWGGNPWMMFTIFASGLAIFCVGLADDVWNLAAPVKLAAQMLALIPLTASGLRFYSLDGLAVPGLWPAALPTVAAIAWVLFFLNAFNFMDGMDGFATRFALHVCLWLFPLVLLKAVVMRQVLELRIELMLVPIVSAACSGFYRVNRPPARVFMGDAGSLSLGYFLGLLPVLADGNYFVAHYWPSRIVDSVPAGAVFILLFPFIFDVVLTILRRTRRGENLFAAHREHLYQRLMKTGLSHREVLEMNVWYFRICGLLAAAYAFRQESILRAIVAGSALGIMGHYWQRVLRRERKMKSQSLVADYSEE